MENKNYSLSRRDWLKAATALSGTLLLSACAPKAVSIISSLTPAEPTKTPFVPPSTNTPAPYETPTAVPVKDLFKLGEFNPGTTPFGTEITPPLMKELGYMNPENTLKYKVDKPERVETPSFNDQVNQILDSTALDNSKGNPGVSVLTDRKGKIVLELVHSMEPGAPGEMVRIIGSHVLKNPEKKDQILGQEIIITPDGQNPIKSTIAEVITVKEDDFSSITSDNTFWLAYPDGDIIMTFLTDAAGIPDSIRNDTTPGVRYLIMSSCTPLNGDYWVDPFNLQHSNAELSNHNTKNRTMLVLRFISP